MSPRQVLAGLATRRRAAADGPDEIEQWVADLAEPVVTRPPAWPGPRRPVDPFATIEQEISK